MRLTQVFMQKRQILEQPFLLASDIRSIDSAYGVRRMLLKGLIHSFTMREERRSRGCLNDSRRLAQGAVLCS